MQLNKHPILKDSYDLTQAIESLGCGIEFTNVVVKASELGDKIEHLVDELHTAIKYLKAGKQQFSPNTTNSLVDDFLKKFDESKEHKCPGCGSTKHTGCDWNLDD